MSARDLRKLLPLVRNVINEEIGAQVRGMEQVSGRYAGGLSREGYLGGYLAALSDVELVLNGTSPSDARYHWRTARERATPPRVGARKEKG